MERPACANVSKKNNKNLDRSFYNINTSEHTIFYCKRCNNVSDVSEINVLDRPLDQLQLDISITKKNLIRCVLFDTYCIYISIFSNKNEQCETYIKTNTLATS